MFQNYHLQNNTNVYFVPLADTQSVTALVVYPVGSRYESIKLSGASHYIEHLMFKGTEKRPSSLVLTREIDRLGAHYNAFTGKELTGYYIKTDAKYTETAFDILSDMLFNSLFDAKEMEREKRVIIEEIRMYKDNPVMNIDAIFEQLFYNGCPLARDVAGTEKTVMEFKREDVLGYRDRYYNPKNMIVVVAGKIDENTKQLINNYFGSIKNNKVTAGKFLPYSFGSDKKIDLIKVERKITDQTQLMFGFPAYPHNHEANPAISILHTILGGSMSSRLFTQIREKRGLAYMIRSGVEKFHDSGYFFVRVGLEEKNINQAIKVSKNEIEKIIDKGVTLRELNDAKTHVRGSLTLSLEDSSEQANWYASEALFMNKIRTPEEKLRQIEAVTNDNIKRVAREIFHFNKMRVAIIGDVDEDKIKF